MAFAVSPIPGFTEPTAFYAYMLEQLTAAALRRAELTGVPSATDNKSAYAYWTFLSRPIENTWVL